MTATSFPREEIRILLLEGVAESAVNTLRNAGYTQIDYRDGSLSSDDLRPPSPMLMWSGFGRAHN